MPSTNLIRWPDGEGWLVLSGGGAIDSAETGEIEAEALGRVRPGDPLVYIWAAGDIETADKHLAAIEDLGAPAGYLVDILSEDDETLRQQIVPAGMIVLGDGPNVDTLRSALPGGALESIGYAFERGAVILAVGESARLFGSVMPQAAGLGWVENAIVVPAYERDGEATRLHELLTAQPAAFGIGIATGSALALGPAGEVEAWGNRQITVTLGRSQS